MRRRRKEEEGPHNKRNGNVSRYFLPRFFLSTTDALRTEPRRSAVSNNGWKKEEETRCPAQIYREAPPAPIYIYTPDDLHETRQHIPREWLVVLLLLLPSCGKRLGWVSRKSWKWNWWLSKATIRLVVIIWRKKDWIWTDLLIENYMISMLRIDEREEER